MYRYGEVMVDASSLRPHRVFLLLCGVNSLLLAIFTPPFQIHDEFQHFFRSYQLSEGGVWGEARGTVAGADLPASLQHFVLSTWSTLGIWTSPPLQERPLSETWREFSRPLDPTTRAFADFSGAVVYSPLPYIPQAIAIFLGRAMDLSPLGLLTMGRVANAVLAVTLVALALRILPAGRWAALVIASLPMAQYAYGSVSPDALIIATAFLFTAIAARAAVTGAWRPRAAAVAGLAALTFGTIKIVYAPLIIAVLPAATGQSLAARARAAAWPVGIAAMAVLAAAAWLQSTETMLNAFLMRETQAERIREIISHPFGHVMLLVRDMVHNGLPYLFHFIGIFGVFNIFMPRPGYAFAVLAISLAVLRDRADPKPLTPPRGLWAALMLIGAIAAIQTALSILNTEPGADVIFGVQGRYFLPLGALIAVVLHSLLPHRPDTRRAPMEFTIVLLIVTTTLMMDWTIASHFNLFG